MIHEHDHYLVKSDVLTKILNLFTENVKIDNGFSTNWIPVFKVQNNNVVLCVVCENQFAVSALISRQRSNLSAPSPHQATTGTGGPEKEKTGYQYKALRLPYRHHAYQAPEMRVQIGVWCKFFTGT